MGKLFYCIYRRRVMGKHKKEDQHHKKPHHQHNLPEQDVSPNAPKHGPQNNNRNLSQNEDVREQKIRQLENEYIKRSPRQK